MSFLWALVFQLADRSSWLTQGSASFSTNSLNVGHSTLEPGPWKTSAVMICEKNVDITGIVNAKKQSLISLL